MHVLTPSLMAILGDQIQAAGPNGKATLSAALAVLGKQEKYLALQKEDQRYDLGEKYGLLEAQLALALAGDEREEVLARLVNLLAK